MKISLSNRPLNVVGIQLRTTFPPESVTRARFHWWSGCPPDPEDPPPRCRGNPTICQVLN